MFEEWICKISDKTKELLLVEIYMSLMNPRTCSLYSCPLISTKNGETFENTKRNLQNPSDSVTNKKAMEIIKIFGEYEKNFAKMREIREVNFEVKKREIEQAIRKKDFQKIVQILREETFFANERILKKIFKCGDEMLNHSILDVLLSKSGKEKNRVRGIFLKFDESNVQYSPLHVLIFKCKNYNVILRYFQFLQIEKFEGKLFPTFFQISKRENGRVTSLKKFFKENGYSKYFEKINFLPPEKFLKSKILKLEKTNSKNYFKWKICSKDFKKLSKKSNFSIWSHKFFVQENQFILQMTGDHFIFLYVISKQKICDVDFEIYSVNEKGEKQKLVSAKTKRDFLEKNEREFKKVGSAYFRKRGENGNGIVLKVLLK